jgi:hypothetical protein
MHSLYKHDFICRLNLPGYFLIIPIFLSVSFFVNAQTPIRAFLTGGDPLYTENMKQVNDWPLMDDAIVKVVSPAPLSGYRFKWHTSPGGISFIDGDNFIQFSADDAPPEFDVYCTVTDITTEDSLILHKRISRERYPYIKFESNNVFEWLPYSKQYYTYTEIPDTVRLFNLYYDFGSPDYQLEITGSAKPFISRITDAADKRAIYLSLNFPQPGIFDASFTIKDSSGNKISSFSVNIYAVENKNAVYMVLGEKYRKTRQLNPILRSEKKNFLGAAIEWTTDQPGFENYKISEFVNIGIDTPDLQMYEHTSILDFNGETPGRFNLSANVKFRDGSEYAVTMPYNLITEKPVIFTPDVVGCRGDTIVVPVIFKNLSEELKLDRISIVLRINLEKLLPAGVRPSGKTHKLDAEFYDGSDTARFFNIDAWSPAYYSGNDTICYIYLLAGDSAINRLEFPFNLVYESIPGSVSTLGNYDFESAVIEGFPMVRQFTPVVPENGMSYKWTYYNDSSVTTGPEPNYISFQKQGVPLTVCMSRGKTGSSCRHCETLESVKDTLYSISGRLINPGRAGIAGEVIAYLNTDNKFLPVGIASVSEGDFFIGNLKPGDYVLLGIPKDSAYNAAYYFNEGIRSSSEKIRLTGNVTDVDFVLPASETNSSGLEIQGMFTELPELDFHEKVFEKIYGTYKSVAFLTDENNVILDWTTLSVNNEYVLTNPSEKQSLKVSVGKTEKEYINYHNIVGRMNSIVADLKISPNPFSDELLISNGEEGVAEFYNQSGGKVLSVNLQPGQNKVCTADLSSGMYFLKIVYASGAELLKIIRY